MMGHRHASLQDQAEGAPCLEHPDGTGCQCFSPFLGVVGTSCKPYSVQRVKRFVEGSVKDHRDHELTQRDLVSWLETISPCVAITENVEGWDMPEHPGDKSTPLQRRGHNL